MTAAIAKKKKGKTKSAAGKEKPMKEQRFGEGKIEEKQAALKEAMERGENAAEQKEAMERGENAFEQEEAMEKEEKAGKEAEKEKAAKKTIDVKLAAAIAIIAVISIAAFFLSQPRPANVSDFWEWNQPSDGKLKMIIVYSDACPKCEVNNSLEIMFTENNIPYTVNTIEQNSAEGQQIIQDLNLIKLPAFLIDGRTIKDSWTVKTKSGSAPLRDTLLFYASKGQAKFEKEVFVFYELSLDNRSHVNMLLGEACGTADHMLVTYFADPYDPATIAASSDMLTLRDMFDDYNAEFVYAYLPTSASQSMQQMFTQDTIETAIKHLVCASGLGTEKFTKVEQAIYNAYCDVNSAQSYQEKVFKCKDGNHFGTPVLGEEMMAIKTAVGLEEDAQYNFCLYSYKDRFDAAKALAAKWQIDKSPTVVVNCTFETPVEMAHTVICSYMPDNLLCRK
jgi:hypothetical protein